MASSPVAALILICLGGAAVAVQAAVNGALGRSLANPLAATTVSFGIGFATLLLAMAAGGGMAPFARLTGLPAWQLLGGLLGAFYVWSIASGIGSVGAVAALSALFLGQMAAGLFLDHVGAFGLVAQPVSLRRLAAVALVALGLLLSRG